MLQKKLFLLLLVLTASVTLKAIPVAETGDVTPYIMHNVTKPRFQPETLFALATAQFYKKFIFPNQNPTTYITSLKIPLTLITMLQNLHISKIPRILYVPAANCFSSKRCEFPHHRDSQFLTPIPY